MVTPKKKKRAGTKRRAKVTAPYKLARKDGERLFVLRGKKNRARVEALCARARAEPDASKRQALMAEVHALAAEPGPYLLLGLMTTDPKVILDHHTMKPIGGLEVIPGDVFYLERDLDAMLRSGDARRERAVG